MILTVTPDREEALKDDYQFDSGNYGFDDEEDEWDEDEGAEGLEQENGETKDESTAYLEFLNDEVGIETPHPWARSILNLNSFTNPHHEQAQKFGSVDADLSDDELGEDSVLLESPLDKIDPYNIFKNSLLSESFPAMPSRHGLSLTDWQNFNKSSPNIMRP